MMCLPLGKDERGNVKMLRADETGFYTGTVTPIEDGKPIPEGYELLAMKKIKDSPWMETEVLYSNKGPAKVNNQAYRNGWDAIFGSKKDLN